jgi:cytosine/adenosine deaminase-related metal-dependent hydrolase
VLPLSATPPGPRRLLLPALANAHDHARTFRSSTLGTVDLPLEGWLPFLGVLPGADPYLCAVTSFARSLRHGVTALMVHYTRVQGGLPYVDEALAVARAARDVGVKIGFAVAMRDRQGLAYCDDATVLAALRPAIREPVARRLSAPDGPPAEHLARVGDLAAALLQADGGTLAPHVTVQYGPNGVQWCTTALLQAVAQASAEQQRPVHMHLLETRYQRDWADQTFPQGLVAHLDQIGLLSPRLTLAHCTWARPDELALLAERGVTVAVNTSSNLGLKSGIAPVPDMLRAGCRVAMGLDGMALDEDDDALREMRLAYALHRGWGYDTTMTRAQLWAFAAEHGRHSVMGYSRRWWRCAAPRRRGRPAGARRRHPGRRPRTAARGGPDGPAAGTRPWRAHRRGHRRWPIGGAAGPRARHRRARLRGRAGRAGASPVADRSGLGRLARHGAGAGAGPGAVLPPRHRAGLLLREQRGRWSERLRAREKGPTAGRRRRRFGGCPFRAVTRLTPAYHLLSSPNARPRR